MLDVVCWKWKPPRAYRSTFDGRSVNVLRNMVARNYSKPHRFNCITDDPTGIDPDIRIIPLWNDFASVPNPSNAANPSCYRRLRAFSEEARELIGERFISLDLDVVITGELSPIFDRTEDFVIWGGQAMGPGRIGTYNWYNGSLWMLRAGTRTKVWTDFDPKKSPAMADRAGCRGSDQGWIAYCLGPKEATFSKGVYSYRNHILKMGGKLPADAIVVNFHGRHDPWNTGMKERHEWVRKHYH